ncbi:hypothetical protein BF49_6879 [Bradyrhizobium sp.]|uniref:terminase large subunit domain-containing protein n=1 Tax=Bradyrhizobium sp. TaxID=376 RepID=UPI0007C193C8|nr:terminase family protein [Bradyrhizobium sp.]CUT15799.1 hypothetical protein BF49_6879 [Bradyrhizobium sp.]
MDILQATTDEKLFARWFKDHETWQAWFAFLCALFALPMSPEQMAIYRQCTTRTEPPKVPFNEAWLVCGRRAGKSFVLALIAVFLACFYNWRPYLSPGERGYIIIIAADRKQAQAILRYLKAMLLEVPLLQKLVSQENAESVELTNGVTIEVATCSYRTVRGRTIVAALCDEVAFWPSEDSSSPDYEVLDALRPGMATVPGAMLLCASSPYARRGAMWDAFTRFFGKNDAPALVWKAPTLTMNPTVPVGVIEAAYERDQASASAEYGAEFRTDVQSLVTREAVEACIESKVYERAPDRLHRYHAFVDPSGGASDSFTLAVAHREGDTVVLDAIRERKAPFSPEEVTEEFCALLKQYRIAMVRGDRYAGEWPREQFRKRGIHYEPSDKNRSELYLDLLPKINSRTVELLDHNGLVVQLLGLERRTSRAGRDSIDHSPGGHDDICNAVAGAIVCAPKSGGSSSRGPISHEGLGKFKVHGYLGARH